MPASGATLQLHDWRACQRILRAGDIGFAEAYAAGMVDTPDLTALLRLALANEASLNQRCSAARWRAAGTACGTGCGRIPARAASATSMPITTSATISTSCGSTPAGPTRARCSMATTACRCTTAQQRKYQRIIDTLRLKPGQRVLEIGCGWGGFAEHAALHGIEVHGVTISPSQLEIAQRRVARAGAAGPRQAGAVRLPRPGRRIRRRRLDRDVRSGRRADTGRSISAPWRRA